MTQALRRAYAAAASLLGIALLWAGLVARPWSAARATADPAITRFAVRETALRQQEAAVRRLLDRRWAQYRVQLAARRREIAARAAERAAGPASAAVAAPAVPAVSVVSLSPVAVTRTS